MAVGEIFCKLRMTIFFGQTTFFGRKHAQTDRWTRNHPGAQQLMESNIPMKFDDCRWNTLETTHFKGHNRGVFNRMKTKTPRCTTTHGDLPSYEVSWLQVKYFRSYTRHKWKIVNFTYFKGHNYGVFTKMETKTPRCTTTHGDQHSYEVSWL